MAHIEVSNFRFGSFASDQMSRRASPNVRYASDSDRMYAPQRTDAMGQSTKSLCDSGEVRLVLSIIPRGEIVGSGGSALS